MPLSLSIFPTSSLPFAGTALLPIYPLALWGLLSACGTEKKTPPTASRETSPAISDRLPETTRSTTERTPSTDAGANVSVGVGAETGWAVENRLLLLNGEPYVALGVCWNPVPIGGSHPQDLDFAGFVAQDAQMMATLGLNVVRTYEPIVDIAVLDQLWENGLRVINSVYPYGGSPIEVVRERVRAVKDHPAILMWALGNEWNYNGLYVDLSLDASIERLNEVAALVRLEDTAHPIATIYGELPAASTLAAMPNIDIWGINSYRGLSFDSLFDDWLDLSEKPMFLSEYGADAYNALTDRYDPDSQARAVVALTAEVLAHSPRTKGLPGASIGGTLFEWSDEWWKDAAGTPTLHDVGGIAPGGGPFPDSVFNEEWWGLVDVERSPRPAYTQLQELLRSQGESQQN